MIVFGASAETLEDTLSFFDHDLREARLTEGLRNNAPENLRAVHANSLGPGGTIERDYFMDGDQMRASPARGPVRLSVVHFLHFSSENEIRLHRELTRHFASLGVPMVNAHNEAVSNCDSKFRMSEILKEKGIPTPESRMVSRFHENKADAVERTRREFHPRGFYVQPDRGTEGEGCLYLEGDGLEPALGCLFNVEQDLILRKKAGNVLYNGQDFVVRLNVGYDGRSFRADSGYCMVGQKVVSASQGAVKENIHRVFQQLGLEEADRESIRAIACAAVEAVSSGSVPPRLAGVDLVLEQQGNWRAYVIDINPRPVVVGSRMLESDAIGLGAHYWKGIFELCGSGGKIGDER